MNLHSNCDNPINWPDTLKLLLPRIKWTALTDDKDVYAGGFHVIDIHPFEDQVTEFSAKANGLYVRFQCPKDDFHRVGVFHLKYRQNKPYIFIAGGMNDTKYPGSQ